MIQIGKRQQLQVASVTPIGLYLDAGEFEQVLMPVNQAPSNASVGDWLDVFIYHDADDRLVATQKTPLAQVDECAYLKVVAETKVGAFLDWGLDKDLLVPFNEQDVPMEEGKSYVVYIFLDEETERLAASARLRDFLYEESDEFAPKQAVDLLICGRTDMGYKAVINGSHLGLIYKDEIFKPVKIGQRLKGYIKNIRSDKRIDLCFQFHDTEAKGDLCQRILDDLAQQGGTSPLTDKSSPEAISQRFNVSKGAYKKAIGALFKQRKILLDKEKIQLIDAKSR